MCGRTFSCWAMSSDPIKEHYMMYEIARWAEASSRGKMEVQVELEEPLTCPTRDVCPISSRKYNPPIRVSNTHPERGIKALTRQESTLAKDFICPRVGRGALWQTPREGVCVLVESVGLTPLRDLLTWSTESQSLVRSIDPDRQDCKVLEPIWGERFVVYFCRSNEG